MFWRESAPKFVPWGMSSYHLCDMRHARCDNNTRLWPPPRMDPLVQVTDIIVCGHYGCGGVRAAMENVDHGLLEHWLLNIRNVQRLHLDELKVCADIACRYKRPGCCSSAARFSTRLGGRGLCGLPTRSLTLALTPTALEIYWKFLAK